MLMQVRRCAGTPRHWHIYIHVQMLSARKKKRADSALIFLEERGKREVKTGWSSAESKKSKKWRGDKNFQRSCANLTNKTIDMKELHNFHLLHKKGRAKLQKINVPVIATAAPSSSLPPLVHLINLCCAYTANLCRRSRPTNSHLPTSRHY